jgi:hypothetical protein
MNCDAEVDGKRVCEKPAVAIILDHKAKTKVVCKDHLDQIKVLNPKMSGIPLNTGGK